MTLKPDNDIYQGDLATLNTNKHAWEGAEKGSAKYRIGSWLVVLVGLIVIIYIAFQVNDETTRMGQMPLYVSIWVTAILAVLVSRQGKKRAQQPFTGFHMAHFEADDDTLYYQFQKRMTLRTYYIKDSDIKKIYRDDSAGVILIEGDAMLNIQSRKEETEEKVSEFYALLPFDKYDLDDLLQPYKKKVMKADGQLRERYTEEHLK